MRRADNGSVLVDGVEVSSVRSASKAGVAHIPEDRMGAGLVGTQSIWRNSILRNYRRPPVSSHGVVHAKAARRYAAELAVEVNLSTTDVNVLTRHLSGGNAQKLVVGRELDGHRAAVIAVNPTQGLDVKAATAVRSRLLEARDRGLAVLLISADLDEVLSLSDRVLVLYEGEVVGCFSEPLRHRDEIGRLMGGGSPIEAADESGVLQ